MSDTLVRIIPTSPVWQPTTEAAQAAHSHVAGLYGGEGGSFDAVDTAEASVRDLVRLIDAGANTTSVTSSACRWQLGPAYLEQLATSHPDGFANLNLRVPCCGAVVPVASHWYPLPVGFARFEVAARNPVRDPVVAGGRARAGGGRPRPPGLPGRRAALTASRPTDDAVVGIGRGGTRAIRGLLRQGW